MKSPRKRAIVKAMKKHATRLVDKYSSVEQARICSGVGIISQKEEITLLDSMTHYGEILWRIYPNYDYRKYPYNLWWTEELVNGI